jgi:hypothetical protein
MSRPTLATTVALAALASLAMPSASHAQFGGLIKKRIAQTAINEKLSKINTDRIALSQRCDALKQPELTDADFALIRAEDAHEDSVGAAAGGFTSLEYGRLRERVVAYAFMPASWKPSGYSADEPKAIDARRVEIRKLVGADFENSGQRISVE